MSTQSLAGGTAWARKTSGSSSSSSRLGIGAAISGHRPGSDASSVTGSRASSVAGAERSERRQWPSHVKGLTADQEREWDFYKEADLMIKRWRSTEHQQDLFVQDFDIGEEVVKGLRNWSRRIPSKSDLFVQDFD